MIKNSKTTKPMPINDFPVSSKVPEEDNDLNNPILLKPLPKLPVPPLNATLEKYLAYLISIIPSDQYETTKKIVEDFGKEGGIGEKLQSYLEDYALKKTNWSYKWWLDDMYLNIRLPLPINSNPGMVFPKQHFENIKDQLKFAARLISGILDYKVVIDARALPVDRVKHNKPGQPLCMEQYYSLFSSYRVPGVRKDTLVCPSSSLMAEPEHIIVICKNQFFVLDVIVNFKRLSEENLYTQLQRLHSMAESLVVEHSVGFLTSDERSEWALSRAMLMEDSTNRDSLDMVERCIFVLVLDDPMGHPANRVGKPMDHEDVSLAHHMLHGGGSGMNSGNRWFDKTMQFIVGEDGACGLVYEHSPSEGVAVVQLIEHLLKYINSETRKRKLLRAYSICELPNPRRLQWKLSPNLIKNVESAKMKIDRLSQDLDLHILRFTEYGKDFPKSQNMSPDSYIQVSLQLCYYKMYGCLTSTYESASTRRFQEGRVDNIRAASVQALNFAKAMVGETLTTIREKFQLFKSAVDAQTNFMLQTILGGGMDCHLLGLKEIAKTKGIATPRIFTDKSFATFNHFSLSTSQVLTKLDTFMCYGPVVRDGYGAAYNPHETYILFAISSFHSCSTTDSKKFKQLLKESLLEIQQVCLSYSGSRIVAPTSTLAGSCNNSATMLSQKVNGF